MLSIRTIGDDAWETDAWLINALAGFHVMLGGEAAERAGLADETVEIVRATLDGQIVFRLVGNVFGDAFGDEQRLDAHKLDLIVL